MKIYMHASMCGCFSLCLFLFVSEIANSFILDYVSKIGHSSSGILIMSYFEVCRMSKYGSSVNILYHKLVYFSKYK